MTVLGPGGAPVSAPTPTHGSDIQVSTTYDAIRKVGRVKFSLSLANDDAMALLERVQQQLLAYKLAENTGAFDNLINLLGDALRQPAMLQLDLAPEEATLIGMRFINNAEASINHAIMMRMLMEMGEQTVAQAAESIGLYHTLVRRHQHQVFVQDHQAKQAPSADVEPPQVGDVH